MPTQTLVVLSLQVILDKEDAEKLVDFRWHAFKSKSGKWYIHRSIILDGKPKTIYLHREIMNAPVGFEVDHINGDTLDNRRENLRIVSHAENLRNRTKLDCRSTTSSRGVTEDRRKNGKRFVAQVHKNGRHFSFGYFKTAEEASIAAQRGREKLFGAFA